MQFKLSEIPTKSLFVDFRGVKIGDLKINDKSVTDASVFDDHHIHLPSSHLKVGDNTVVLNIYNNYRKDGVGMHSYTDTVD